MSFIDELEELANKVSDYGLNVINDAVEALSTDGRPFGKRQVTDEDRLAEYLPLRGNPDAWLEHILMKANEIIADLKTSNVPDFEIYSIHPFNIAVINALNWSAEMESLLASHGVEPVVMKPATGAKPADTTSPPGYKQVAPTMPAEVALQ